MEKYFLQNDIKHIAVYGCSEVATKVLINLRNYITLN